MLDLLFAALVVASVYAIYLLWSQRFRVSAADSAGGDEADRTNDPTLSLWSYVPVSLVLLGSLGFYGAGQGRELLAIHVERVYWWLVTFDVWTTCSAICVYLSLLLFPLVPSSRVRRWYEIFIDADSFRQLGLQGLAAAAIAGLFPAVLYYNAARALDALDGQLGAAAMGIAAWVVATAMGVFVLAILFLGQWLHAIRALLERVFALALPAVAKTVGSWSLAYLRDLYATAVRVITILFTLVLVIPPIVLALALVVDWAPSRLFPNAIVVVNVLFALSLVLLKIDSWFVRYRRWSHVGAWLILALLLGFFDANDNHGVSRTDLAMDSRSADALSAETAPFDAWLQERGWMSNSTEPFPVFLVAAQGGGIYAANHAAQFLGALQDEAPQFARHVFGISAVSGGSLGAGVFAALVQEREGGGDEKDWFKARADRFLGRDFLTNLAAATVFIDLPARALPCLNFRCPGKQLNRARAFEVAVEQFWNDEFSSAPTCERDEEPGCRENPWRQALATSWSAKRDAPMLWLNTTEVETGETVVLHSGGSVYEEGGPIRWYSKDAEPLRLSTAVGISAAFPVLAPASWYTFSDASVATRVEKGVKRRLVDGGYFDNSGVLTALGVRRQICKRYSCASSAGQSNSSGRAAGQLRVVILVLTLDSSVVRDNNAAGALGELLSVFRAFGNARGARARVAIQEANITIDGAACFGPSNCLHEGDVRVSTLSTPNSLPLGWQLAPNTRCAIQWSIGIDVDCGESFRALRGSDLPAQFRQKNECVLASVLDDLGVDGPYRCRETLIKTTDGF